MSTVVGCGFQEVVGSKRLWVSRGFGFQEVVGFKLVVGFITLCVLRGSPVQARGLIRCHPQMSRDILLWQGEFILS